MIRGLYASGWSMMANSRKMDIVSNNLSNVNTTAFKKDTVVYQSFPELITKRIEGYKSPNNPTGILGTLSLSSDVSEVFTHYEQGHLSNTGNRLDVAIDDFGNSFFTIAIQEAHETADEITGGTTDEITEVLYTRDGTFKLNSQNVLVTKDGYPVLGENGIIQLQSKEFTINEDGTIMQDGAIVDRLLIRSFADTRVLRKVGANMVNVSEETEEETFNGKILQGYLRESNVNIIKEMVSMINVLRAYEANQKILQIQDGTLEKAVSEVGHVK